MKKRNVPRSSEPVATPTPRELRPERAFVVHLDVRAELPRRVVGRVEHVTSGQVAYVTSLSELIAFMATVLRNPARADAKTTAQMAVIERR